MRDIDFTVFFLVHWGVMFIFYKYDFDLKLTKLPDSIGGYFGRKLYNLSQCDFCVSFWIALILLVPLQFIQFDWINTFYPLMSASLINIIYTIIESNEK